MILQTKLVNRPYNITVRPSTKVTDSLTIPGQSFNLKLAMEQYKRGNLVERVKGFYEKEGFVTPDFKNMSKIEKMEALADYRRLTKEKAAKLDAADLIANQKHVRDVLEKEKAKGGKAPADGGQPDSK